MLINTFSIPQGKEEEFVKMWTEALEFIKNEPGFIDAKLHRSLDPNAQFQFINVAHWETRDAWQAAFDKLQPQELTKQVSFEQIPALYEVAVHFKRE
ncbi:antibiotic biosynthesis monooxygenase family protein [Leptolyngbya sp. FACHB-261]|uniref:antibiotic biosynthesis monooxygenase family protein n=1 Tax=Leptolyngbya sp. FACHB-261 TaxID=2692806 RepID=UPI0028C50C4F|nr:antibiotic biosynthesis monooxygenase family protein [Leptolyngbya sp. FACHB-261]